MKMIGTGVYVNVWMMCSNTIAVMADPVSTGVGGRGGHCQIAGSHSGDYLFIGS